MQRTAAGVWFLRLVSERTDLLPLRKEICVMAKPALDCPAPAARSGQVPGNARPLDRSPAPDFAEFKQSRSFGLKGIKAALNKRKKKKS